MSIYSEWIWCDRESYSALTDHCLCVCLHLGNLWKSYLRLHKSKNKRWFSSFLVSIQFPKIFLNSFLFCIALFCKCNYIQGHVSPSSIPNTFCCYPLDLNMVTACEDLCRAAHSLPKEILNLWKFVLIVSNSNHCH